MNVDNELDPQEMAFQRSAEMEWNGAKLQPFSFLRKTASQRLGVRWWNLSSEEIKTITEEDAGEKFSIQVYDELGADVAKVLWLCCQDDDTARRARRQPEWAETQIDEWAEGKIFGAGLDLNPAAYVTFLRIMNDVQASEFEVEPEKKTVIPEVPASEQSANPSSTSRKSRSAPTGRSKGKGKS